MNIILSEKDRQKLQSIIASEDVEFGQRAQVLLYVVDGMSIDEVSALLDIPSSTIIDYLEQYATGKLFRRCGRPRKAKGEKHRTFRISMSPSDIELIQAEAARMDCPQSIIQRAMVAFYRRIPLAQRWDWIREQLGIADEERDAETC